MRRITLTFASRAAAAIGIGLALAVTGATAAIASRPNEERSISVAGTLSPQPDGTYRVTGDLVGSYRSLSETVVESWTIGTTKISVIEGTDKIIGCVDRNHNGKCDRREPTGEVTMAFRRLATFDVTTGAFVDSNCTHPVIWTKGRFIGGLILMADQVTGRGHEIKWRTDVDGYTTSFVGEYFGGKAIDEGGYPGNDDPRDVAHDDGEGIKATYRGELS